MIILCVNDKSNKKRNFIMFKTLASLLVLSLVTFTLAAADPADAACKKDCGKCACICKTEKKDCADCKCACACCKGEKKDCKDCKDCSCACCKAGKDEGKGLCKDGKCGPSSCKKDAE